MAHIVILIQQFDAFNRMHYLLCELRLHCQACRHQAELALRRFDWLETE